MARAAGVSKGTIYNHFGGRDGLIDAVIDELVADKLDEIALSVRGIEDPFHRLYVYIIATWWSAYYEPVVADVLATPEATSHRQADIRRRILGRSEELLAAARTTGQLRDDVTTDDIHYMIWSTALVIRHGPKLNVETFRRRADQRLEGLRVVGHGPG